MVLSYVKPGIYKPVLKADHTEIYNLSATPFDKMESNLFKTNGI